MTERIAYERIKAPGISERYLPLSRMEGFLETSLPGSAFSVLGYSVEKRPVYGVHLGSGPIRVLLWSQMHGNETTTTRAVLDLINCLTQKSAQDFTAFEFLFIPMLNPDGADTYSRKNANDVDLNRDAQRQSQPESRILRKAYTEFEPHYCFNLHDQRTIFSVGDQPQPATLSFLAPAANAEKDLTENRSKAARLIAALSRPLRDEVGIGRYDDTFNPDCVGDFFQASGTPTMLFEAGHYPGDYEREQTRFFVYLALKNALKSIESGSYKEVPVTEYMGIPENKQRFLDILIRNAHLLDEAYLPGSGVGLQYAEVLEEGRIQFRPDIVHKGELELYFGHKNWDAAKPEHLSELLTHEELMQLFSAPSG